MPAYAPYDEEQPPISPWATRDVYGNPLPIPDTYGIQDAPPYDFRTIRSAPLIGRPIKDAPPYGFIQPESVTPQDEDYYLSGGERFSPGSETAVAFDEPSAGGVRYPIATPRGGSFDFSTVAPGLIRTPEQSQAAYDSISQYQAELARADRNRLEEMQQQDPAALQAAVRLQGLMKYRNLIQNGTNPAEAIRLAAPELYFNHPQATALATHVAPPAINPTISTVAVPGGNAILSNGKIHSVLKTPAPPRELKPVIPPDAKFAVADASAEVNDIQHSMRAIQDEVNKGRMDQEEAAPKLADLTAALEKARSKRMNLSTNWMNTGTAKIPSVEAKESPDSIREQYRSGKLNRDEATKRLKALGFK